MADEAVKGRYGSEPMPNVWTVFVPNAYTWRRLAPSATMGSASASAVLKLSGFQLESLLSPRLDQKIWFRRPGWPALLATR
jgi:hypothetical protein